MLRASISARLGPAGHSGVLSAQSIHWNSRDISFGSGGSDAAHLAATGAASEGEIDQDGLADLDRDFDTLWNGDVVGLTIFDYRHAFEKFDHELGAAVLGGAAVEDFREGGP